MLLQLNGDYQWKDLVADPLLRADQSGRADPLDPASYILPPRIDRRALLAPSWYRYTTEAFNFDARFEAKIADGWTGIVRSEEHTSELQSLMRISYAVFCLKKKN